MNLTFTDFLLIPGSLRADCRQAAAPREVLRRSAATSQRLDQI